MGVSPLDFFKAQKPNFMKENSFDGADLEHFLLSAGESCCCDIWQHSIMTYAKTPAKSTSRSRHWLSGHTGGPPPTLHHSLLIAGLLGFRANKLATLPLEIYSSRLKAMCFVTNWAQSCSALTDFPAAKQLSLGNMKAILVLWGRGRLLSHQQGSVLSSSLSLPELVPDLVQLFLIDCQKMCWKLEVVFIDLRWASFFFTCIYSKKKLLVW